MSVRADLKAKDEEYELETAALKAERDQLQENILNEMKVAGRLSERYDNATATIAVRKSVKVLDEKAAVADLKSKGLTDYVTESLSDLFHDVFAKEMAKEGTSVIAGVEINEKEYLSIRENKSAKEDKRKVTVN
jgi:hypothetical protein